MNLQTNRQAVTDNEESTKAAAESSSAPVLKSTPFVDSSNLTPLSGRGATAGESEGGRMLRLAASPPAAGGKQ